MAEEEGFEPSKPFRRFQPLTHSSAHNSNAVRGLEEHLCLWTLPVCAGTSENVLHVRNQYIIQGRERAPHKEKRGEDRQRAGVSARGSARYRGTLLTLTFAIDGHVHFSAGHAGSCLSARQPTRKAREPAALNRAG